MNTSPEKLLLMMSIPVFLFVIPVLFLLMLPSLIFSNDGLSSVSGEALNDTSIILDNISDAESCMAFDHSLPENKIRGHWDLRKIADQSHPQPAGGILCAVSGCNTGL